MRETAPQLLTRAMQYRELKEYKKAQEYLDLLLDADPENHIAWYEKSKLPIVQEDTLTVRNRSVSLSTYQRLSLAEKNSYLQQCGFDATELPDVENSLRAPHLIAEQSARYLKMAIRYAPAQERIIYEAELHAVALCDEKQRRTDRRTAVVLGLVALPVSVAAALLLLLFPNVRVFKEPLLRILLLAIPYILSIVGIAFYRKAKSNGAPTVLGFVCSLVAILVSALSIIHAVIAVFVK